MPTPSTAGARMRARERDGLARAAAKVAAALRAMDDAQRNRLCRAAGVPRSVLDHASSQGRGNAEAHMALCFALGIDPVNGSDRTPAPRPIEIYWPLFATAVALKRAGLGLNIRDGARAAGVSVAVMSRAENQFVLSAAMMFKLCAWVGVHPEIYTRFRPPGRAAAVGKLTGGNPSVSRSTRRNRLKVKRNVVRGCAA